jgi:hypothetical protein
MHEEERVELERFKKEGRNPDKLNFDGVAYDGSVGKGGMLSTYSSVPDSPPGSSAGPPEKTWDPTGSDGMVSGMRSTVPLLHGGSADHPQSPGLPPPFPPPASPVNRGFSTSPRAPSRAGSTGPQAGGYSDRVNSPAPGSPHRSPSSPAPHDVYGMSRLNSPGPMLNRGPGSPGPRGGQNGGPGGNSEGGYWNNGGYR